jgi:DNA-binding NarL/FixJ family response regulator
MGSRPWQARAQCDWAAMLLGYGGPDEAARAGELLADVGEHAAAMGMAVLGARVTELQGRTQRRRSTTARRSSTGARRDGLSAREREVAALVADGLTNRQIAEKLYVSERTAETHVQNILVKLGFASRAQVASWAVRTGVARGEGAGATLPRAAGRHPRGEP